MFNIVLDFIIIVARAQSGRTLLQKANRTRGAWEDRWRRHLGGDGFCGVRGRQEAGSRRFYFHGEIFSVLITPRRIPIELQTDRLFLVSHAHNHGLHNNSIIKRCYQLLQISSLDDREASTDKNDILKRS